MNQNSEASQPCAFLWDESFLWGLMAYEALLTAGLDFDIISSDDVRAGNLGKYTMVFVPGGWASNKLKALGNEGVKEVRRFVENGGSYLGFCGGAGLATLDGIGLLNVNRMPTKRRVPSFSGKACFSFTDHSMWDGASGPNFHVWWPSQFLIADPSIKVLAAYAEALPESYSSDLNVGDVMKYYGSWSALEHSYGINLDPARLKGQPAVVEGICGKGKVLLSLVHFDTPDDADGRTVLVNLWKYLADAMPVKYNNSGQSIMQHALLQHPAADLDGAVDDLIAFGERHFLWFWRNRFLLQWKRGIRGLEYCTLRGMIKAVAAYSHGIYSDDPSIHRLLQPIRDIFPAFKEKAERLLLHERMALQNGHLITYDKTDDPHVKALRAELFANSKSYGGQFKELLDEIDKLVLYLLRTVHK
ncbi:MAG TPA: BPL-N domain-containing protein [Dissulfurispiraceae bacterium]|nr:BPL-N domain-containing protein [Dissulfurispiraceae bacterium]